MKILPLPRSRTLELRSPLPMSECVARINARMDNPYSWSAMFHSSRDVVGRIAGAKLRLRKKSRYRNSFRTFFTGTLRDDGDGASLSGVFSIHPFTFLFTVLWMTAMILIGGVFLIDEIRAWPTRCFASNDWTGLFFLPGIVILAILFVWFGRWLARDEEKFLTEFLISTTDGRVVTGGA